MLCWLNHELYHMEIDEPRAWTLAVAYIKRGGCIWLNMAHKLDNMAWFRRHSFVGNSDDKEGLQWFLCAFDCRVRVECFSIWVWEPLSWHRSRRRRRKEVHLQTSESDDRASFSLTSLPGGEAKRGLERRSNCSSLDTGSFGRASRTRRTGRRASSPQRAVPSRSSPRNRLRAVATRDRRCRRRPLLRRLPLFRAMTGAKYDWGTCMRSNNTNHTQVWRHRAKTPELDCSGYVIAPTASSSLYCKKTSWNSAPPPPQPLANGVLIATLAEAQKDP